MKKMKEAKWAAVGISLLIAVSPPAKAQTATAAFTPTTGKNYVIRNVETGQFLRCSDKPNQSAYFDTNIGDSYFLWQFSKPTSGDGWYLKNVGKDGYLNNDHALIGALTFERTCRGKTDDKGAVWHIIANTWNKNGYLITSNSSDTKNSLYAWKHDGWYYLCSTVDEMVDLNPHGKSDYYQLPTFQFYTYDQLYDLAKKCGYTDDKVSSPTLKDWNKLADQIGTPRRVDDENVASTEKGIESFVIASRRYHRFLSMDAKGGWHASDKMTTSSVFYSDPDPNGVRVISGTYHGEDKPFTLYYANNGHANDFKLMSGNQYLCVDNNGEVRMSSLDNNKDLALLDDEWVIKPTPYDTDKKLPALNVSETDIKSLGKEWFFRIENNAKRIKLLDKTAKAEDNVGGYLNDVDKAATATLDKVVKQTSIHLADVFSNSTNLRDAANLWRVTKVANGKDDEDAPIGVVSYFTHNIYCIQNVNSGKYIGLPSSTDNKNQLMPLVADAAQRAYFYFVPKDANNENGAYALMLLDKTASSSQNKEIPMGWLDIADTDDNGNGVPQGNTTDMKQAALIYRSSTTDTELADDAYNWSIHRARFIEARTADGAVFGDKRYVTLWFPFDIVNTDANITLYTGRWNADQSSVLFKPIEYGKALPAGKGALVLAPKTDDYKVVRFELCDLATEKYYAEDLDNDILLGVAEGEDYYLDDFYDAANHKFCRDSIYVFSETKVDKDARDGYKDVALCLGHPADPYLMANRCYIRATKESEAHLTDNKGKGLSISFDDKPTDGITLINAAPTTRRRFFDLQGREVSRPQHGIYITNGKKIFLR